MVIHKFYDANGIPVFVIVYRKALDGTLSAVRLVYARAFGFSTLWDAAVDPVLD